VGQVLSFICLCHLFQRSEVVVASFGWSVQLWMFCPVEVDYFVCCHQFSLGAVQRGMVVFISIKVMIL
jgi:hypothetical protein